MNSEEISLIKLIRGFNAPLAAAADISPCLMRLDGVRAVLCDVYGTMLASSANGLSDNYSCPDLPAAFRESLRSLGVEIDPAAAVAGVNRFNAVLAGEQDRLKKQGIAYPEVDVRTIWKQTLAGLSRNAKRFPALNGRKISRLAVEYENRINPAWPMPGLEETLCALAAAGVQLGIVSNAQFYTPLALTALLGEKWRSWFKPSLCFWSYEHREAKPGPELYQRALAALEKSCGIKPPEAVMIGNSIANDVRPALACGCRAVLFAGDRRACRLSPDDRRRISSRRWPVITGWPQLMKIIVPGP